MKKYLLFGGLCVVVVGLIGVAVYWFMLREEPKPSRGFRDRSLEVVAPVAFPMKGQPFIVPSQSETTVTLDLVSPSATRDYPMARFALATGTGEGQLIALDDYATPINNGLQAVPIVVSEAGSGSFVYLATLRDQEGKLTHTASTFLGDRIKITVVRRQDSLVTVSYLVHDREQAMTDTPTVATTAIIDVGTGTFVQEGRKPWLEADVTVKQFTGTYWWQRTTSPDDSVVTPLQPNTFSMIFDGPRVTLTTDCNTGSSEFTPPIGTSTTITFGAIATTKMFCESQQEGPYFAMVTAITTFTEAENGDLTFTLGDGRVMSFTRTQNTLEYSSSTSAGE